MRFGLDERRFITGTGLYSRVFQITALLPAVYILLAAGYMELTTRQGPLAFLFNAGISALPRIEALALSFAYRITSSEIVVDFAVLAGGFVFGLIVKKLLFGDEKTARRTRIVLAALIGADLLIRLLPLRFNMAFGLTAAATAFAVRLCCLILIVMDLRAARTKGASEE